MNSHSCVSPYLSGINPDECASTETTTAKTETTTGKYKVVQRKLVTVVYFSFDIQYFDILNTLL